MNNLKLVTQGLMGITLASGVALVSLGGCGSSNATGGAAGSSAAGAAGASAAGAAGSSAAAAGSGGGATGPCYPTDPSCGIPGSTCQSLVDQTSNSVKNLRINQIIVTAPKALASSTVQTLILDKNTYFKNAACYQDGLAKGGLFNWLLQIDTVGNTLKTGGAQAPADPSVGYSFFSGTVSSLMVAPITVPLTLTPMGTGEWTVQTAMSFPKLYVPVFQTDPTLPPIILPISNGQINMGDLREGGNCIGRFRGGAGELVYDPGSMACLAGGDYSTNDMDNTNGGFYLFVHGATLTGAITIAEADQVPLTSLPPVNGMPVTLCAFIAGISATQSACSMNMSAAMAASDTTVNGMPAFMLSAEISASGVKIN